LIEANFTPVFPNLIPKVWDRVEPMISLACEHSHGRFSSGDVLDELVTGAQVLWILYSGDDELLVCLTTSVCQYPGRRMLSVPFCGGLPGASHWISHRELIVEKLVDWAKRNKCSGIEASGRPAWEKVLSPMGFKKTYTTVTLNVEE